MKLNELTLTQAHEKLVKKEISSVELTQAVLDEIDRKDPELFCYLEKASEMALEKAKEVDKKITEGEKIAVLAGIPAAIKDNILVEGIRCTAASRILENYTAPYDATVVKKLKNQDAVILGKTNLDEFAMGSSTENSGFGPTKNPIDPERVPGGSSGGSAAAVAANLCIYALGSDTGGSIRQPASFCGIVGLKPTYGAVSRYGLIAMASSLDQIGPIAKTVEDAAIVFQAISGRDPMDSTSVELNSKSQISSFDPAQDALSEVEWANHKPRRRAPKHNKLATGQASTLRGRQIPDSKFSFDKLRTPSKAEEQIQNIKIGVPKEYFVEGMDSRVEEVIKKAILELEKLGAKIEEVSLPHTKYALACYYLIMPSEVSANLARYDGIKYGMSTPHLFKKGVGSNVLMDIYLKTRQKGFGDEVRRRVMLGTYALSAGYYEAYYLRAQKVRTLIKRDFERAFQKVDVLLTPTSPTVSFKFGERAQDPLSMYLSDIYTVSINLAGVPAISIPCGEINGLPVGLQIIGKWFDEETIFRVARAYENIHG